MDAENSMVELPDSYQTKLICKGNFNDIAKVINARPGQVIPVRHFSEAITYMPPELGYGDRIAGLISDAG